MSKSVQKLRSVFLTLLALALTAAAADINGKWVGQVPRGGNSVDTTFTFTVEGEKLTGTVADSRGSTAIADGRISGDTISFSVNTERGKRTFTGKVAGNEIKFKREGGQNTSEFVAKRP